MAVHLHCVTLFLVYLILVRSLSSLTLHPFFNALKSPVTVTLLFLVTLLPGYLPFVILSSAYLAFFSILHISLHSNIANHPSPSLLRIASPLCLFIHVSCHPFHIKPYLYLCLAIAHPFSPCSLLPHLPPFTSHMIVCLSDVTLGCQSLSCIRHPSLCPIIPHPSVRFCVYTLAQHPSPHFSSPFLPLSLSPTSLQWLAPFTLFTSPLLFILHLAFPILSHYKPVTHYTSHSPFITAPSLLPSLSSPCSPLALFSSLTLSQVGKPC